jgi:ribose 5-phosphate isomerase A
MGDPAKRAAGWAALDHVEDGMLLGLGTGSTVRYFLEGLAERRLDVVGVPTSRHTTARCRELGIRMTDPSHKTRLDLCVDGADELTEALDLLKGGGGALLREKVVATMSDRMIVVATTDKIVERLADAFALPIEVVPFASGPVARWLAEMGFHVEPRERGDYLTDNGNMILDCRFPGGLARPAETAQQLCSLPGVAEHGLFLGQATLALVADDRGTVRTLSAPPTSA